MRPKEVIALFVELFNNKDYVALSELYHKDAINHQVPNEPIFGKEAIKEFFRKDFEQVEMFCIVENIFEDKDWAILEWKDPLGLRGCGFFNVIDSKIKMQRGYWDQLSFLRQHNLPIPKE